MITCWARGLLKKISGLFVGSGIFVDVIWIVEFCVLFFISFFNYLTWKRARTTTHCSILTECRKTKANEQKHRERDRKKKQNNVSNQCQAKMCVWVCVCAFVCWLVASLLVLNLLNQQNIVSTIECEWSAPCKQTITKKCRKRQQPIRKLQIFTSFVSNL